MTNLTLVKPRAPRSLYVAHLHLNRASDSAMIAHYTDQPGFIQDARSELLNVLTGAHAGKSATNDDLVDLITAALRDTGDCDDLREYGEAIATVLLDTALPMPEGRE